MPGIPNLSQYTSSAHEFIYHNFILNFYYLVVGFCFFFFFSLKNLIAKFILMERSSPDLVYLQNKKNGNNKEEFILISFPYAFAFKVEISEAQNSLTGLLNGIQ